MWIARQKSGDLYLFTINEPYRYNGYWENEREFESNYTRLDNSLFPELTWDDEPVEIELISKTELVALKINNALYREEHSDCLWCSSEDETKPETKVFDDYWTWDQTKCQKCKFFDGYDVCCKKGNFGSVTTERLNNCVIKHLFEKKD